MHTWLILSLVALLSSSAADADDLTLASGNVRIFSTGSRTDTELALITDCLEPFDLVAIQERRDEEVVDRTLRLLTDRSAPFHLSTHWA